VVGKVVQELGRLDILVNNASVQHMATSLEDITPEQLQETFAINVFGYFYMAQVRQVMNCNTGVKVIELWRDVQCACWGCF
jgi:NAD(P)-dependent dehydrogenase (short-subunit alcohol dehydrogenase family)